MRSPLGFRLDGEGPRRHGRLEEDRRCPLDRAVGHDGP